MAYTATGSWVGGDDWYAWLNVSKSNTSDTVTKVTVTGGIYNVYAVASYFTADITSDSAGNTTNYSVGSLSEYSGEKTVKTNNINVTRGTSQKTLTVMCRVNGSGGYSGYSSTAKTTVTIPAKTSYPVTYNANGGTGAPSNQTKWYGDTLKLSTTVPTRTDYNFLGWNTKADGTGTNYAVGANYTINETLALYAKGELAYARPTISDLSLIRCTNASGYPASEEGTYAKLSFKGAFDTHASSGTYLVQWREVGQTGWTDDRSGTLSGNTGTFAYTLLTKSNFSASTSYQIQLTVTDGNDTRFSTSMITVLTQGFAHIVLGGPNHPHSVGIGKTPTANEILDVGIGFSHTGGAVTLDSASKAAWLDALGISELFHFETIVSQSASISEGAIREFTATAPTVAGMSCRGIVQTWYDGSGNPLIGASWRTSSTETIHTRVRANSASTIRVWWLLLYTPDFLTTYGEWPK